MTEFSVAYSTASNSKEAGSDLGSQIRNELKNAPPDVVIVFASSRFVYTELLQQLKAACQAKIIVGCSSAGEFVSGVQGESAASAIAIRSSAMQFNAQLGRGLRADRGAVARTLAGSLKGRATDRGWHRAILLLSDALAGHTDDLVEQLALLTGGSHQIFGGGAGDDAQFTTTHVFCNEEASTDAAVALEILSRKPLGVGASHGWQPASEPMRVTAADGMRLISLNAIPTVEVLREYAEQTNQKFEPTQPLPFFLHNVFGIKTEQGYKLRVPLDIKADGSIVCASDVPVGAVICLMRATVRSSIEAAQRAVTNALGQMEDPPGVALFFDCVATRLRMGQDFGVELQALQEALGKGAKLVGCNTYGQIIRAEGQFSGFHNCTAVVCVLPG